MILDDRDFGEFNRFRCLRDLGALVGLSGTFRVVQVVEGCHPPAVLITRQRTHPTHIDRGLGGLQVLTRR